MKLDSSPFTLEARPSSSSTQNNSNGAAAVTRLRSTSGLTHPSAMSQQSRHNQLPAQFATLPTRSEHNEQEVLLILSELNSIIGSSLEDETLALSFRLLEKRFDPTYLATIINENDAKR
jgi:hypothetical protein